MVWADVQRPPPTNFFPRLHVPLNVVLPRNSSLSTRFLPFDIIETEAVFVMDDDSILTKLDFARAFRQVARAQTFCVAHAQTRLKIVERGGRIDAQSSAMFNDSPTSMRRQIEYANERAVEKFLFHVDLHRK